MARRVPLYWVYQRVYRVINLLMVGNIFKTVFVDLIFIFNGFVDGDDNGVFFISCDRGNRAYWQIELNAIDISDYFACCNFDLTARVKRKKQPR